MKPRANPTAPPHPGEVLKPSSTNARVRRWMRVGDPPAKPTKHKPPAGHEVDYHHPVTGKPGKGTVHASGALGATVIDHETGEAHKVPHGRYLASPAAVDPKKAKPAAPVNWRETHPGLSKYPAPGITDVEEGKPADNWRLRWTDAQGRTQRAYDTAFLKKNAEEKFAGMVSFGKSLPRFRETVREHMRLGPTTELGLLGTMGRIVDETLIRAGGESEDTHGITTLEKRHVKVDGSKVTLSYIGKGSVPQEHTIDDRGVAAAVRHLLELPGDTVWQFENHKGDLEPINAARLRQYVADHTDGGTTKSFRTWHATRLFSEAVDKLGPPSSPEDAEAKIKRAAAEAVAPALGHKKAKKRGHFVKVAKPGKGLEDLAAKHGGKHAGGGVVGFHSAKEAKGFQGALGDTKHELLPKEKHPDVEPEYEWEPMTSLNNYIDPKVVEAYRKGITLSGALRKAAPHGGGRGGMSPAEVRFAHFLDAVDAADPYGIRKGAPREEGG